MTHSKGWEERFWESVTKTSGCWIWTRPGTNNGYGVLIFEGKRQGAHRVAYQLLVGPIPNGFTVDHLCRVKRCVNPDHLEAVTRQENSSRNRGDWQCFNGHTRSRYLPGRGALRSLSFTCPECDEVVAAALRPYLKTPLRRLSTKREGES